MPNWENLPTTIPKESLIQIKNNYGLKDKFIILFGGNMGKPQKLENIIELAKTCTDFKDIIFINWFWHRKK